MSTTALIGGVIGLLLGVVLGVLAMQSVGARRHTKDRATIAQLTAQTTALEQRLATEAAALEATIERVSNEVAAKSSDRLAAQAAERFEVATTSLKADLDLRDERLKSQVDPIKALLEQYKEYLAQLETSRVGAYRSVTEQIKELKESGEGLRRETKSLVTALRTPHTRGRWGEMQLRRVVEMAGMVEHCDFIEQATTETEDSVSRPDLLVTLPGGGVIVVDAKAPLAAYLDALEAEDERARLDAMSVHARQLRDHVDALSKKAYWNQFDATPDFVVCFVPGESLLAGAFEADPGLVERAMESRVLLTGPTTLIALLRTVGFGWRQEAMARNALEVQALGQELYERLATMGGHLERLGRSLERTVGSYNDLVGSTESRVLVTARRFPGLGVVGDGAREIPSAVPVDVIPRLISATELTTTDPRMDHPAGLGHEPLHVVDDES